jgi:serine/threonine-protein kinase
MGSVWVAEHLTLHSLVAVKLIEPRVASNPDSMARFVREARAAAALRSPHVVQILDHGVDDGTPYIVMELLEGESLAARLVRLGRLDPLETARILTQVGRAVARAHDAGIIHRDLKPDNIFLVANDDEVLAKVLDFGVAKAPPTTFETSGIGTQEGAFVGTPAYMSPEQAEGMPDIDWRSDLWSLGVIAFECLVGRRPFVSEGLGGLVLKICSRPLPMPSRLASVPEGFNAWFARACARNPDHRFTDAKEQAAELRRVCEDSRMTPWQPSMAEVETDVPADSVASSTKPYWEKEPKPRGSPARRRSRRRAVAISIAIGSAFGLVAALRFSGRLTAPAAPIVMVTPVTVLTAPAVSPPSAAPAAEPPLLAEPAEPPAKTAATSTTASGERSPARRAAPPAHAAPKRAAAAPPVPAPAPPPSASPAPPPQPTAERVNLGI